MRGRAALGAAVLVLAAMAPAAQAQAMLGGACSKDSDCDTGLCNVYFTVRGSPRRAWGTRTICGARAAMRRHRGCSALCVAHPRAACARGARERMMLKLLVRACTPPPPVWC